MVKQLFTVEITHQLIVVADDEYGACEVAMAAVDDDGADPHVAAAAMTFYPADWDDTSIPHGESDAADPDRTVGQWIALGAAPRLSAKRVCK